MGLEGKPAFHTLEDAGFKVAAIDDSANSISTGYSTVYKQSPAAGSKVKKGSTVAIYFKFHPVENENIYEDTYEDTHEDTYEDTYDETYDDIY